MNRASEDKIIAMLKEWYLGDVNINAEWVLRGIESYQFYTGIEQWDDAVRARLQTEGRPALTINHVFPIINMLTGYQMQNRSDIKLYPRRGGSVPIADLGTELIKHTMDVSDGLYDLSDSFHGGCICGKGFISVDRTFLNDPVSGDLEVEYESPFDILPDQTNKKYNINKGNHVFRTFWWNKKEIELQYPGKAKLLKEATESPEWASDKFYEDVGFSDGDYEDSGYADEGEEQRKSKYKIRECWYKEWEKTRFLIHRPTLTTWVINEKEQAERALKEINENRWSLADVTSFTRPHPILKKAFTVGDMLLEHKIDPLQGITLFPFMRFTPYWIDGYVMGAVDNIKGPQREVNKRRSQALHVHNQTANTGFIVDKIVGDYDKTLKKFGSKPGVVLDRSKAGGIIERLAPMPLDAAALTFSQMAIEDMEDISGVNPDITKQSGGEQESGKSRLIRQQAGLVVSQIIYENFDRTQEQLGEFLWEVTRRSNVYSLEEIAAVVDEKTLRPFLQQQQQGQEQGQQQGGAKLNRALLRSMTLGRYGVKVSKGANLPTIRMANYEQLLDAMKQGLEIPPEYLLDLSDLPNKEEIIRYLRKMSQFNQQGQGAQVPARQTA